MVGHYLHCDDGWFRKTLSAACQHRAASLPRAMIYVWMLIGLAVLLIGGWGWFAVWLLPYPDTGKLLGQA